MLVKMDCGIKTQHNTQTTFSCIFSWNPNGTNKKVPLLQYVSVQWFLYEPSYSFFPCAAGSFCLWWKLLTWPTCWNRREISPSSPQATRLLLVWLRVIWRCWRVGLPDFVHLLTCFNHQCCDLIVTQKINKWMCLPLCFSGDTNALRTILLYHINKGVFIGGGLETGVTNLLKSLQGSNIKVMFVSI